MRTYGAIYPVDAELESLRTIAPGVMIIDDRCLCRPERHETLQGPADAILYSTGRAKFADLGFGGYAMLKPCTSYSPRRLPFSLRALTKVTRGYTCAIETNRRFEYRDCDWLEMADDTNVSGTYWEMIFEASERAETQKKELNSLYSTLLPANCQLPPEFHTWRFNIMVKDKTQLIREVFRAGLFASSHFAPLTGIFADGNAPEANRLHRSVVNLFNDHFFDARRAKKLASVVTRHLERVLHQQ